MSESNLTAEARRHLEGLAIFYGDIRRLWSFDPVRDMGAVDKWAAEHRNRGPLPRAEVASILRSRMCSEEGISLFLKRAELTWA